MSETVFKRRKTQSVRLTKFELTHLRDLMGLVFPDSLRTVSQSLAAREDRTVVEAALWAKIIRSCEAAGLPVGDDAPDYVVATEGQPTMNVFHLASEMPEGGDDELSHRTGTFRRSREEEPGLSDESRRGGHETDSSR